MKCVRVLRMQTVSLRDQPHGCRFHSLLGMVNSAASHVSSQFVYIDIYYSNIATSAQMVQ